MSCSGDAKVRRVRGAGQAFRRAFGSSSTSMRTAKVHPQWGGDASRATLYESTVVHRESALTWR